MVDTLICTPSVNLSNLTILISSLVNQTTHDFDFYSILQGNSFANHPQYSVFANLLATFDVVTHTKITNYKSIGLARYEALAFAKKMGYRQVLFVDDDVFLHPTFIQDLFDMRDRISKEVGEWSYLLPSRMNFGVRRHNDPGQIISGDEVNWIWPFKHGDYMRPSKLDYELQEFADIDTACVLINLNYFDPQATKLNPTDFPPGIGGEDYILAQDLSRQAPGVSLNTCQFLHIVYNTHRHWVDGMEKNTYNMAKDIGVDSANLMNHFERFRMYEHFMKGYLERNHDGISEES